MYYCCYVSSSYFFHLEMLDSWFQVGFVLTTGINSAYVLGYPGTVMVPLGWIAGVVGLIIATIVSLNANALIAKLHEFGGKRHIRYRDLAGHIYGMRRKWITLWILLDKLRSLCLLFWGLILRGFNFISGRRAYALTWGLQYVNLFMINTGYIILAGQALKVCPIEEIQSIFIIDINLIMLIKLSIFITSYYPAQAWWHARS